MKYCKGCRYFRLSKLDLSTYSARARNALQRCGVDINNALLIFDINRLSCLRGVGKKTIEEILQKQKELRELVCGGK